MIFYNFVYNKKNKKYKIMNYTYKINQIQELSNENEVFQQIVKDNKRALYWHEIIDIVENIQAHTQFCNDFSKRLYLPKNFLSLEKIGIDYNYLDATGNNFLQYALHEKSHIKSRNLSCSEEAIEYIISKTSDVYNINSYGQHILFDMITISNAGVKGEDFFNIIKKFPDFNLHQIDKSGKNLLNYVFIGSVHKAIVEFLLEQNLSTTHIDNDGHNMLHNFCFSQYKEFNKKLFAQFLLENDICYNDKWNNNCLITWMKSIHYDQDENAVDWLLYTIKLLDEGLYLKKADTTNNLYEIFKKNTIDLRPVKNFVSQLHCQLLDEKLNNKNNDIINKKVKL